MKESAGCQAWLGHDETYNYNPWPASHFTRIFMTATVPQTLPLDVVLRHAVAHDQAGQWRNTANALAGRREAVCGI